MLVIRFLGLVLILNVPRYGGGLLFEPLIIFPGLFGAMEESASYFRDAYRMNGDTELAIENDENVKAQILDFFQTYLPGSTGALEANIQSVDDYRGQLGALSVAGRHMAVIGRASVLIVPASQHAAHEHLVWDDSYALVVTYVEQLALDVALAQVILRLH